MAEQIIIEYIVKDEQLIASEAKLADMGKVEKTVADQFKASNTEINKQVAALKEVGAATQKLSQAGVPVKKNLDDLSKSVKGLSTVFMKDFKEGATQALKDAGVSAEEFEAALAGVNGQSKTLKQELRQMTEELAQMKLRGESNSQQYQDLAKRAGELKDAIGDANQEVKNFASDTSTFDGLIGVAQGLAGGFAVAQGAAALLGDESEELQKTLLRVNAAMAILQGLQQVQNTLQKESAASMFLNTVATKAQTVAQRLYTIVVGQSVGALRLFRIALASTGIGLLVFGVIELIQALKSSNDELAKAEDLIESNTRAIDAYNEAIQRVTDVAVARAEAEGAAQSRITQIRGQALQAERANLVESNRLLTEQRNALGPTTDAWFALNEAIQANSDTIKGIDTQLQIANIQFIGQLAQERKDEDERQKAAAKEAAAEAKRLRDERLQAEKEARAAGFADFKAQVELELLAAEQGSEEQLEIRKRLARAELQLQLDNDKLTQNQRKLLIKKYFADRLQLEKDFAKNLGDVALANIQSDINRDLAALEITRERRLELTEETINLQADIEIGAAEGNMAKIEEINARRNKAIRDARLATLRETVEAEITIEEANAGTRRRALQRELADEKTGLSRRIEIINQLAQLEAASVKKRIDALVEARRKGLISQEEYNVEYAVLVDQYAAIWENAENAKVEATDESTEEIKRKNKEAVEAIVQYAGVAVDVLSTLYDIQSQKENNRLAEQKQNLKDLQDAGAITEKEAISRQKRIDAEERRLRVQQAQRDKQIAVFKALLAIPQAYLQGLAQGGLPLAIVYGAIAAVQAALVIARPIPKFGKGKKNSYQGLAEVGETGPELIQRGQQYFIADKPQVTWLSSRDKVFNPHETIEMLSMPKMNAERIDTVINAGSNVKIDYDKIGKAVGKHVSQNIYVDGVQTQARKAQEFLKYLDQRRGYA